MHRIFASCLTAALIVVSTPSEASFTGQASAGASYIFGGKQTRGPITFDIGPGYQMLMFRAELPLVFAAGGNNTFPPSTEAFMGLKPSIKIFPWDPFYAKLSTQLFWSGDGYYGVGIGGGVEYTFLDLLGGFFEVTVNPYFEKDVGTPIEARLGMSLIL